MKLEIRICKNPSVINILQKRCLPLDETYLFEGSFWWAVFDSEIPVGFGGYCPSDKWDNTIYLCRSGILEEYRGNGLQKKLIKRRLKHAKRKGFEWAYTDTTENPASANSLISCGFKMYIPDDPWGTKQTIYWRRRL